MPELWTPVNEGPHEAFVEPEPGFGMITIYVQDARDRDLPDALVIPIGLIRRFELRKAPEERVARFGFSVPAS